MESQPLSEKKWLSDTPSPLSIQGAEQSLKCGCALYVVIFYVHTVHSILLVCLCVNDEAVKEMEEERKEKKNTQGQKEVQGGRESVGKKKRTG